jgi:hypothetical protein
VTTTRDNEGEVLRRGIGAQGSNPKKQMERYLMDVAENYQLGFQDPASPIMEGIINFYNYVFIYLTFVTIIVI